jgi:transmembrane sensor
LSDFRDSCAFKDMSDEISLDATLVDRYVAGECTLEEGARIRATAAEGDAEWASVVSVARAVELQRADEASREQGGAARGPEIRARADGRIPAAVRHVVPRPNTHAWLRRSGIAAGVVASVAIAGVLVTQLGGPSLPQDIPAQTYRTSAGERVTVQLANGTHVTLAPSTTARTTRDGLVVDGEVYVAVAPRSSIPFVVRTRNAVVRVLGTRFTVRQYDGDASSRVVVVDGRVSVRPFSNRQRDAAAVLVAQTMGEVTDSGVTTKGVNATEYVAWTTGRLIFRGTPLRDVVAELSRAYGATILVQDSVLAKQAMTMQVSVQSQPLQQLLQNIGFITDARVVRSGHAFVLTPGRSAPAVPARTSVFHPEKQYGR